MTVTVINGIPSTYRHGGLLNIPRCGVKHTVPPPGLEPGLVITNLILGQARLPFRHRGKTGRGIIDVGNNY